jgi:putative transposase
VVVDVLGLLIGVVVHSAAIQDRDGAKIFLKRIAEFLPQVKIVWADSGYAGKLIKWVKEHTGWKLEIVKRPQKHIFTVLPKRWIVERTFGWLMFWRIMNRHHERKYDTAENIMRIIMIKKMLRDLSS